ncbi:MAG: hypothetical protein LUH53_05010, partial [Lachnospiraceae bacterium]|nr:hypothetical protein [Lachnospiraceae bacterium]
YDKYSNMMYTAPWGKCYNRAFLKRINAAFTPGVKRAQDGLFNAFVYKYAEKGLFVSEIFYNYRVLPDSATHGYHADAFDTAQKLIACYRKDLGLDPQQSCPELDIMITRQFMYCIVLNYCHKKNNNSYRDRKREFLSDLNSELFRKPVQNADIKELCAKEYVIAVLMRHRCFALINLLNKARTL